MEMGEKKYKRSEFTKEEGKQIITNAAIN